MQLCRPLDASHQLVVDPQTQARVAVGEGRVPNLEATGLTTPSHRVAYRSFTRVTMAARRAVRRSLSVAWCNGGLRSTDRRDHEIARFARRYRTKRLSMGTDLNEAKGNRPSAR